MESITNKNEISRSPRYHQHQPILELWRFSSLFSARAQMTRPCVIKLAQNPACFQTSTCSNPTFVQASEYHAFALSTSRSLEIFTPKKSPDHPSALSSNPTPSLPCQPLTHLYSETSIHTSPVPVIALILVALRRSILGAAQRTSRASDVPDMLANQAARVAHLGIAKPASLDE
jgi:hypothetical protein